MATPTKKSASKVAKKKAVTKKKSTAVKVKAKAKSTAAKKKKPAAPAKKKTASKAKKPTTAKKKVTRKAQAAPAARQKDHAVSENKEQFLINGKFKPYDLERDEEYMCDDQLVHFRNILEAWKNDLMEEVDHTLSEMKEVDNLADLNDRASQEESFALELRTRDRERKLIRKIESALQQIEDQDYGFCESCGIEIGIRRLEARPTASLCIECKTLAEIREKRA